MNKSMYTYTEMSQDADVLIQEMVKILKKIKLFMHFFINIGMSIGIIPTIGIPLPYVSYGGSSFLSFSIMFFIYLNFDSSRLKES